MKLDIESKDDWLQQTDIRLTELIEFLASCDNADIWSVARHFGRALKAERAQPPGASYERAIATNRKRQVARRLRFNADSHSVSSALTQAAAVQSWEGVTVRAYPTIWTSTPDGHSTPRDRAAAKIPVTKLTVSRLFLEAFLASELPELWTKIEELPTVRSAPVSDPSKKYDHDQEMQRIVDRIIAPQLRITLGKCPTKKQVAAEIKKQRSEHGHLSERTIERRFRYRKTR
jgi:hypothetical protein